jgi:hypothetical protein
METRQGYVEGGGVIMEKYKVRSYTKYTVLHEHVALAEESLGRKLKSPEVVHHADGDMHNNCNSNLVLCPDMAYHKLLHVRLNAYKSCGNPNHRACAICKVYDSISNMAVHSRKGAMSYVHIVCRRNKDNNRYAELRKANHAS